MTKLYEITDMFVSEHVARESLQCYVLADSDADVLKRLDVQLDLIGLLEDHARDYPANKRKLLVLSATMKAKNHRTTQPFQQLCNPDPNKGLVIITWKPVDNYTEQDVYTLARLGLLKDW